MKKEKSYVSIIIVFIFFLLIVSVLSLYSQSISPFDWYWAIREEMLVYSKIDTFDSDIMLTDEDWNELIYPFINIDSSNSIESIDIYGIHPIKRDCVRSISWKENSIDEYLRDNSDYMIRITGWRPKRFLVLLLATAPVYDKPYYKKYDNQEVSGMVIDIKLPDGIQKTYIMVFDELNVFYEKSTDEDTLIYRRMPKVLLEKFILRYGETMKQFRKNTK